MVGGDELGLEGVRSRYSMPVFDPPVPKSVRFAEAPAHGRSILAHAPRSAAAEAYRTHARALHAERLHPVEEDASAALA